MKGLDNRKRSGSKNQRRLKSFLFVKPINKIKALYKLGVVIGTGNSIVYKAKRKRDGKIYALKQTKLDYPFSN